MRPPRVRSLGLPPSGSRPLFPVIPLGHHECTASPCVCSYARLGEAPVLISCWSAKGGAGTTVVAAALAVVLARSSPSGALLVDLAGDAPAVLGLPDPGDPGLAGWLTAGADVPADALHAVGARRRQWAEPGAERIGFDQRTVRPRRRLGRPARRRCAVGGRGLWTIGPLGGGRGPRQWRDPLAPRDPRLLPRTSPRQHDGGPAVRRDPGHRTGRALGRSDVEQVVGAPVRAEIAVDPAIARAVDAGVLSRASRGAWSER